MSSPSKGDLVAGVSVALVAVPQALAYAELAGMPAHYGLYAAALPSIMAAFFVSSPQLQTGPVALTSLLTFGSLSGLAAPASGDYVKLAALLALLVGLCRVALGVLRMGRVAFLLSEPVLVGFTTGAAVLIVASQLPRVFDAAPSDDSVLIRAAKSVLDVGAWNWQAVAFAAGTAAIIVAGRRLHALFPGVLVAVVAAIAVSGATGYDGATVGELTSGFLRLSLDFPWGSTSDLIVPAIAIALVGFAEPASIARTFSALDRTTWNADREMFSQGIANVTAGLSGAFPVGGSFSRSSLNRLAGATSPWAGAISGLCVAAALPVMPLYADLPSAVLGAIVILAVLKLIRVTEIFELLKLSAVQGMVAAGTFVLTIASAPRVERGVIIGVGLSIAAHLYRELTVELGSERRGDAIVIRPAGVIWFAVVPAMDRLIRVEMADNPDVEEIVIDLEGVGRLDYSGAAALARLCDEYGSGGLTVRCVNVPVGAKRAASIHLGAITDDPAVG